MSADDLTPDLLAALEQQLVSPQTRYVAQTYDRLLRQGVAPGDAKAAIAECLADAMETMLRSRRAFDEKSYREDLEALGRLER